jgi:hypothetical protein
MRSFTLSWRVGKKARPGAHAVVAEVVEPLRASRRTSTRKTTTITVRR